MQKGYSMTAGSKIYFMPTTATKRTKNVVNEFIDKLGHYRGLCVDLIERCKSDSSTFRDIQRRMDACTVELKSTGTIKYYHIEGSNYIENIPLAEAECLVILK